jgi:hypothetical protein
MTKTTYCVHVLERREYEDIRADSPYEAEERVVRHFYAGNTDDIAEIFAMVTCPNCHYDNDGADEHCDEGAKLL